MDIFFEIGQAIDGHKALPDHPFFHFEPWDVSKRPADVRAIMEADGVDLYGDEFAKHVPSDPHPFQTGYFLSTKRIRCIQGASRIGKSIAPMVELMMMATGEFPICFRYAKGVVTPVKRKVTPENIRRWGRRDSSTGDLIDFDVNAPKPETWHEWDCGYIVGVGLYPQEKVAPIGAQIWLGTFAEAKARYWWPKLAEPATRIIPDHMLDKSRGNDGINRSSDEVYLIRNITLPMLTYEQGHKRFEAERAWAVICDEETPTREIFASALKHCEIGLSEVFTPLHGITWSKRLLFPASGRNPDVDVFHATAYDSPYVDRKELATERKVLQPWELQSRHWGLFAEAKGEPYFDRTKLNKWIHTSRQGYRLAQLKPSRPYAGFIDPSPYMPGVPSLAQVSVNADEVEERDMQTVWKIYEAPIDGQGYVAAVDIADGGETPEEAGDFSQCFIMRPPNSAKKEVRPVVAATLRSSLPPISFARPVELGMRYYNMAKLAAETKRGWGNGVFSQQFTTLPDWMWITYTSIHAKTGRAYQQKGFDPNSTNRPIIFELIRDYIDECEDDVAIEDEDLLKELAAAITTFKGGKKRCDHSKTGTLDAAVAFGIGLFVVKNYLDQITCNVIAAPSKEKASWFAKFTPAATPRGFASNPEEIEVAHGHKKINSTDPVVREYMGIFADAFSDAAKDRERMRDMQAMYDNLVDEGSWPTTAKMSVPLMLSYVLQNLPHTMEYLFPDRQWLRCIPAEAEVDIEQARNTENALQHVLMNRMKLKHTSFPTFRDSYKLGVGFGIVEPVMVTPMQSVVNRLYGEDRRIKAQARKVIAGVPKRSIRYKYISPGRIVVTKDGVRFNGEDRVSIAFYVDDYGENVFRQLMKAENSMLKGDAEAIIKEAREMRLDARVPITQVIEDLAGRKINYKVGSNKDYPVRIPVIKCYGTHRHLWIANGTTIIFDKESDSELRCPLQKADAGQDGDRFYPLSVAEACQRPWLGVNLYVSGLYDMLTQSLNPMLAYDKSKGGSAPERNSSGLIGTYGPIRDSIGYIAPPSASPQVFTIGETLLQMLAKVTAESGNMSPGMVRGGGFALADLMKSTYGQQVMADAMMGTGFLLPVAEHTLAELQEIVSADGSDNYAMRDWKEDDGEEYIRRMSITEDDVVHAYEIEMDLRAGSGSGAMEYSNRVSQFDRLSKSEYVDQWENTAEFIGDYKRAKRLLFSRKKVKEMQEQKRLAALQAQVQTAAGPGGEGGPMAGGESTPTQEALAGAGAAALGGAGGEQA